MRSNPLTISLATIRLVYVIAMVQTLIRQSPNTIKRKAVAEARTTILRGSAT